MSDDNGPKPYPDYDSAWRAQKAEAKSAVQRTLSEYDRAVQVAILVELAAEYVHAWAEHTFSNNYEVDDE